MMGFPQRIIEHTLNAYVLVEPIRRNLEAYVDDMVIKSNDERMLLADIIKTFDNLRRINMKLNPKKFSFGMEEAKIVDKDETETWTLLTDGASNNKGSRACLVIIGPSGKEYTYALRLNFKSTNNEAEYEALLAGLHIANKMKVQTLDAQVRILELKRRNQESVVLTTNTPVSIKEDTAYMHMNFTRNHEDLKSNTPYPEEDIRRIHWRFMKDSGRYLSWSPLQENLNTPY
ncbi:reverse transcriptase domain-containing protein [Tanacetum coccineum]